MTRTTKILFLLAAAAFLASRAQSAAMADDLKRRGMIGVQLAPLNDEMVKHLNLSDNKGIVISGVMPNTAAEEAGLKGNDILRKIDQAAVESFQQGLTLLRRYRAGDTVPLTVIREGSEQTLKVTLRPRPLETWTDIDVVYDSAGEPGKRVRTILTKPKSGGKRPAVVLLPEPIPNSVEFAGQMQNPVRALIESMTKAGFVTMRVERLSVGDSEGSDLADYTIEGDAASFRSAIAKLKSFEFVDGEKIFLLTHGPGAALAPLVARGSPIRGIVTYAAVVRPVVEVIPEMLQRRWKIDLVPDAEVQSDMEKVKKFIDLCLIKGKKPADIFSEYPDFKPILEKLDSDDTFVFGMHYKQAQQLAGLNSLPQWAEVKTPVLAVWGKSDFVADKKDSEMIVAAVKKNATFLEMAEIDHMFGKAADQEESALAGVGTYHQGFTDVLKKWLGEQGASVP